MICLCKFGQNLLVGSGDKSADNEHHGCQHRRDPHQKECVPRPILTISSTSRLLLEDYRQACLEKLYWSRSHLYLTMISSSSRLLLEDFCQACHEKFYWSRSHFYPIMISSTSRLLLEDYRQACQEKLYWSRSHLYLTMISSTS